MYLLRTRDAYGLSILEYHPRMDEGAATTIVCVLASIYMYSFVIDIAHVAITRDGSSHSGNVTRSFHVYFTSTMQ